MAKNVWKLSEAKKHLSELVNKVLSEGPQVVTRQGEEVVVILSKNEYEKIIQSQRGLVAFFGQSPLVGVELDLERARSLPRETPV